MDRVLIIRRFKMPEVMQAAVACSKFSLTMNQLTDLVDTGDGIIFENKEYWFDIPIID